MIELYRAAGLDIYEKAHYSRGEHVEEVEQILSWYRGRGTRVLDIGCSGGLHALEFARRGFTVIGIDIEPDAVAKAVRRSRQGRSRARFLCLDVGRDRLTGLGRFDLVYALGNVLSHLEKPAMARALGEVRERLVPGGTFLFDLLMKGRPFRRVIRDNRRGIVWTRDMEPRSGRIRMDGCFLESGWVQPFEMWGYSLAEAHRLVRCAGLAPDGFSGRLDFADRPHPGANLFCLNFRTNRAEDG
jgi:SAM-dependent methyltransferase